MHKPALSRSRLLKVPEGEISPNHEKAIVVAISVTFDLGQCVVFVHIGLALGFFLNFIEMLLCR